MHKPASWASSALAGTGGRPQVWQVSNGRMRRAGMLVPVWSLRRDGTQGIGDTTAVRELVDWAAELLPLEGGDRLGAVLALLRAALVRAAAS